MLQTQLSTGDIVEYLDKGSVVCALAININGKRVRILNQKGRESNLPAARIVHHNKSSIDPTSSKDDIIGELNNISAIRAKLAATINLVELWDFINEEPSNIFSPEFLAEILSNQENANNIVSALLRAVFLDKLYFKFHKGSIKVHSKSQVENLQIQAKKEQEKRNLIHHSANAINLLLNDSQLNEQESIILDKCLGFISEYYLLNNDAEHASEAKDILKECQLNRPNDPFNLMVKAGIWDRDENIPKLKKDLPDEFSEELIEQADLLIPKDIDLLEDPGRLDFTHLKPLTIDGASTLDFDDALTVEKDGDNFLVGIHISDVAHYIKINSPLFNEAMRRGTSIYFADKHIPMLPKQLSQGICSLVKDKLRAVTSYMILLSPEGEVLRVRIKPSVIRVARRLTYTEADKLIENSTDSELKILNSLAIKLRDIRLNAGALLLPFPDVNISIDSDRKVHITKTETDTPARSLISEFMILTNSEAARFISDRMAPGLYRAQGPPRKRLVHGTDNDLYLNSKQRKFLSRGELGFQPKKHNGLGVEQYTTVTSPIRRFLDLIMQHQLNSIIRRQPPAFSSNVCKDYASVINRTTPQANNISRQRHHYWLYKYLEQNKDQLLDVLIIDANKRLVNVLISEIMLYVDVPAPQGAIPEADTVAKIKILTVSAIDNTLRCSLV